MTRAAAQHRVKPEQNDASQSGNEKYFEQLRGRHVAGAVSTACERAGRVETKPLRRAGPARKGPEPANMVAKG
jgi:hypothetical protein